MTLAITGATSMLGVATIKNCISNNISVLAFVRKGSSKIKHLPSSPLIKTVECDLAQMKDFNAEDLSADVFIHFGWAFTDKTGRNDVSKQLENVQYTIEAVHLAKRLGCRKFVGAGSQAEYGTPNVRLKANTPVNPLISYGVAKYAAGRLSAIECKKEGLAYNWVRILSIYGPHDNEGTLIKQLVYNAKNNIPMGLSGCEQVWDYLHEDDAGAAFVAVAEKGVDGKIYPLGSGVGRSLREYVQDVISVVNPDYKPEYGKFPYSPTQPMYLVADVSELEKDTRWKPNKLFMDK
jgi:nucleoside-diphosphate-sugar epimerase